MAASSAYTSDRSVNLDTARALLAPVITKPPSLSTTDKVFIDKAVRHFASVDGAKREHIRIRTTTRQADRTICNIYGLPSVSMSDIDQLDVLSDRVNNISIELAEQFIRVELANKEGNSRKKRRRGRASLEHTEWNLTAVASDSRRHVKRILDAIEDFDELECQLAVEIKQGDGVYYVHITPCESIRFASMQRLARDYRTLISDITFDIPAKKIILEVTT